MKYTQEQIQSIAQNIDEIVYHYKQLYNKCSQAIEVGLMDVEGSFFATIWETYEHMLENIDIGGWINWYIFDNNCGTSKLEAQIGGQKFVIANTQQLAEAISLWVSMGGENGFEHLGS